MKCFNILALFLLTSALSFYSCKGKTDGTKTEDPVTESPVTESPVTESPVTESPVTENPVTVATDKLNVAQTPAQPNAATLAEPAQNAAGVWHYTCPKGCAGGAGLAGNCATCGSALSHNQAYHGNTSTMQANPATAPAATTPTTATPQPAEPAQNAAGVWHYTCPKGCAGGAGTVTTCATCGGTLEHNQAYHN